MKILLIEICQLFYRFKFITFYQNQKGVCENFSFDITYENFLYLLPFQRRWALFSILSSSRSRTIRLRFHGYILRRSEKGADTPSCDLCTFDNMRLGRFYNAWSTHRIFQIVERRRVRTMRWAMPVVIIDMLQFAFLGHISYEDNMPV